MVRRLGLVLALAVAGCRGGGGAGDAPVGADAAGHADGRADAAPGFDARAGSYATDFDGVEAPISEAGAWTHVGLDWTRVETDQGIAFGTQTGTGGYDDSYAHLAGFPSDQSGEGVVSRMPTIDPDCTHEVEVLLRWSDADHDAHGYEFNLAWDGAYAQIVRWEGPFAQFTFLSTVSVPGGVHDGDVLRATAIGQRLTLYLNGVELTHADDATFADGNPGIGFWRGGPCGVRGDYGFTRYVASPQ